jgi:hypothetical protein
MHNGFDLPSRMSSRKGSSNPSDARKRKQRAPLHRRRDFILMHAVKGVLRHTPYGEAKPLKGKIK